MSAYIGQTEYDHKNARIKRGVLLCNLGTPEAPTAQALRPYLKEFLSDPRVVEVPRLLWWCILNGIILRTRPKKSAAMYKEVWTDEGSPLMLISKEQVEGVKKILQPEYGDDLVFALGMRYGNPSMESAIAELTAQNVREIIILPLYPQYCAATSGSTFDAVAQTLTQYRWVPTLHFISGYHKSGGYLNALANSIQRHIDEHGMPDKLLFSYHGTPERYLKQGDPYHCFCHQTTRLVRERLNLNENQVMTTFQSRFGKEVWLQPYTDHTIEQLAKEGTEHIAVICPGFSADCLETIEEIDGENREIFMEHGGKTFHYIPALNSEPEHLEALAQLIREQLN